MFALYRAFFLPYLIASCCHCIRATSFTSASKLAPCLDGGDVADGELLSLADEDFGLEGEVAVGEDHVVGVGDARVRDEGEGREDGLQRREDIISYDITSAGFSPIFNH